MTHSGPFHSDDVFAAAILHLYFTKKREVFNLIRSRDLKVIEAADIVFDVGGIYDPLTHRYDHHQPEGAGERENKMPYASIGLIWKHFGMPLCDNDLQVWQEVDEKLVQAIDADDVGISLYEVNPDYDTPPYLFKNAIKSFYVPWNETGSFDLQFKKVLIFAKEVIQNEIILAKARFEGAAIVEQSYQAAEDKRIIVLQKSCPWKRILSEKEDTMFCVYGTGQNSWNVQGIPKDENNEFDLKAQFPEAWAGLNNEELEKVSGITGATFCHRGRWLAGASTREAAVELAKKAVLM